MIGNSITVINKSGKVISSGKQLASVWKEAKAAYKSRKAEIKSSREVEFSEHKTRHALKHLSLSDEHLQRRASSHAGSSRSVRRSKTAHRSSVHHDSRPGLDRGVTDSVYANDVAYAHPTHPPSFEGPDRSLIRRHTDAPRPGSSQSFDEHLAYGKLPVLPMKPTVAEAQLKGKMTKLNQLLDEANCLQYTATAMIDHLQKNPEALAAVGLSLAEISQLVRKVGPGMLMNMKIAFPAVVALLASPQFLIAGGVAVGVTVVMLGGYKIIKRIKAQNELDNENEMDQLREIDGECSRIEMWRRGIAEAHESSAGTTVDGEFITPRAHQHMLEEGVMQPHEFKPVPRRAKSERSHRSKRPQSVRSERTTGSKRNHSHHHHHSSSRRGDDEKSTTSSTKDGKRKKALSGLKLLFQGRTPA